MKNQNFKIGQEVYLPRIRQFGIVEELTQSGLVKTVRVTTPDGDKLINALNMIVVIARIVETGLLPIFKAIFVEIKSWFR